MNEWTPQGGRYEKLILLQSRPGGELYRAFDRHLERGVWIKRFTRTDEPARFAREAAILGSLKHVALPWIHEAVAEPEAYLVMRPAHGRFLSQLLDKGPVPEVELIQWMVDLLGALEEAHRLGFVHRDVRPENVFIERSNNRRSPLLLGFTRARATGSQRTSTGQSDGGIHGFVAPEEITSDRVDLRTDVHGVAAVLYYALEGREPRPLALSPNEPPKPPEQCSPRLAAVLMHALDPDPSRRFQSAAAFADELRGKPSRIPGGVELGDTIGRLETRAILGHGGMGVVYLAWDRLLKRHVALKLLSGVADPDELLAEARAMAKVQHPNIVSVYEAGMQGHRAYLVMEHIAGGSLAKLLAEGPVSLPTMLWVLEQAARGLDAVHRAGLTHGDIKPANILLGPAGRVCLADFGLARARATTGELGYTPAYAAPELFGSHGISTAASDIYQLGVVVFEMITGRLPFDASGDDAWRRAHRDALVPVPSEIVHTPFELDLLIQQLLAKSPKDRPGTQEIARRAAKLADTGNRPVSVLIVDSPSSASALSFTVQHWKSDAVVRTASTAAEALALIAEGSFDLVFFELELEGNENGVEFVARSRAELETVPPLVAISATGAAADWQVLSALGVRAFLPKPINSDSLDIHLARLLPDGGP